MSNRSAHTLPKFLWKKNACQPPDRAMRKGEIELHALSKGPYPGTLLKPCQLPGIESIGFWNAIRPQEWEVDPYRNEGLVLSYLETGAMEFFVGTKPYHLHSRSFTVTRPWQLLKLAGPTIGPGKMHWLILDVGVHRPSQNWIWPTWLNLVDADKGRLTRKLQHNKRPVWTATVAIASIFGKLSECVLNWKNGHAESRMIVLLNQLLLEILAVLSSQQVHEAPESVSRRNKVALFLNRLAQNGEADDQRWTLESMVTDCGMSVTTFSKYCRELVNTGPVEFLNQCRLARAARQLREDPAKPIISIAFENGFNSSQYFATVFHREFGLTPSEYRKGLIK